MLRRTFTMLCLLLAGLLMVPAARADSQVRIVRLSLVEGGVQIDRSGEGFEKAIMNMPITQGVKLSTDNDARAEVEFEDGTTLRLAPGTHVAFPQLGMRSSGDRFSIVQVDQGTAYFNVRHKRDDDFRVVFANREIKVDHNVHFRLDLSGGNPELAVFKGELEVNGPQERAKLKRNETLTLDVSDADRFDVAKSITPLSYDSWDDNRINYASQYASNSYSRSPYSYGNSDLNYYGSWSSWPGYGMLWRPFGVGYGWDPFYNGAWAWYPGFGYTWVSTYPWGWTPYRYGSWVYVSNYGWGWRPGGWRTWYTVPPVYNAPAFYHVPKPPPPVTVVGPRKVAPPPMIMVDQGVGIIRGPRRSTPAEGFVPGTAVSPGAAIGAPPAATVHGRPARNIAPAPGTGIVAPGSPMPMHGERAVMHPRSGMERSAPTQHQEHNAPRMERSAPRMERSAPAPRTSAPPSGGHSGGRTSK